MPRQARRKSESGIYHILLRGINQQQIFEDDEDFEKFLQVLKDCKKREHRGRFWRTQGTVLCVDKTVLL